MMSASPSPLTSPAAATEGPGRNLRLNVAGLRRVKATPVIWKPPPAGTGSVSIRPLEVRPNTTSTRPMLPWSDGKPDVARSPIPSPLTSPSNATRLPITLVDEPAMRSVAGVVRSRVVATAALAAAGAIAAVTATLNAATAISRCRRLPGRGRSIAMLHFRWGARTTWGVLPLVLIHLKHALEGLLDPQNHYGPVTASTVRHRGRS